MRHCKLALLLPVLCLSLATSSIGQGLEFKRLTPTRVELGGVVGFQVKWSGREKAELLAIPKAKGLAIRASGPQSSSMTEIIGGRVRESHSTAWEISVRPLKIGTYTMPSLSVRVAGKVHKTAPVELRCVRNSFAEGRVFVEVRTEPEHVFVNQPVDVVVRFGIDRDLAVGIYDPGWQVSVPVRIVAPWLSDFPAGVAAEPSGSRSGDRCVLNNERSPVENKGRVQRDGQDFMVFELRKRFLTNRAGRFVLEAPRAEFRYADPRAPRDFLTGEPRRSRPVLGIAKAGLELLVGSLPEEGKPKGFRNAVGRFELRTRLSKRSFKVGEQVVLSLAIEGSGNLEFLDVPDLDDLPGFNRFDRKVDRQKDRILVNYDIVALDDKVKAVPAIQLPYFDPVEKRYRVAEAAAIPVDVAPLPKGKGLDPLPNARKALEAGKDDIYDRMAIDEPFVASGAPGILAVAIALSLPPLLLLLIFFYQRHRRNALANPARGRRQRAARAFEERLAEGGALRAFTTYLADVFDWDEAAAVRPDLARELEEHGTSTDLASKTEALLQKLLASRYSGAQSEADLADATRRLVASFEAELPR